MRVAVLLLWLAFEGLVIPTGQAATEKSEASGAMRAAKIVVSVQGAISGFQTAFEDALRRAEAIARSGAAVEVELPRGVYHLNTPIVIANIRGGTLTVRGQGSAGTILSGSLQLGGWEPVAKGPYAEKLHGCRLYVSSKVPSIREDVATLLRAKAGQEGVVGPPRLYLAGASAQMARWPRSGYVKVRAVDEEGKLLLLDRAPEKDTDTPELPGQVPIAYGYFSKPWADEYVPIVAVDAGAGRVQLATLPQYGTREGGMVQLYNGVNMIRQPGDWILIRTADRSMRFVLCSAGPPAEDLEASVAPTLLQIVDSSHVKLEELGLRRTRGASLTISRSSDISVDAVAIEDSEAEGIIVDGIDITLSNLEIQRTGAAGIVLRGRRTPDLARDSLVVKNSLISAFGQRVHTYEPGVRIYGVGNSVTDSTISGGPDQGIIFGGNDHLIARNRIVDVVAEAADAGAIYTGRNWSMRGTVIADNVICAAQRVPGALRGTVGVYLDDLGGGTSIVQNVIGGFDVGVMIGGGSDNKVVANSIMSEHRPLVLDARGVGWARTLVNGEWGMSTRVKQAGILPDVALQRYPMLRYVLEAQASGPERNIIWKNSLFGPSVGAINHEWADRNLIYGNTLRPREGSKGEGSVSARCGERGG